jgi:hypothetical protein
MITRIDDKGIIIHDVHGSFADFSAEIDKALAMPAWRWAKVPQAGITGDKTITRAQLANKIGIWSAIVDNWKHQELMLGKWGKVSQQVSDAVMSISDAEWMRRLAISEQAAIDSLNVTTIIPFRGIVGVDKGVLDIKRSPVASIKSANTIRGNPSAKFSVTPI